MWAIATDEFWRNYTNATTIPQYFKENGYISVGMGKIFHPGKTDLMVMMTLAIHGAYHTITHPWESRTVVIHGSRLKDMKRISCLMDKVLTMPLVATLKELKKNMTKGSTSPFFLAIGFLKPHLAFSLWGNTSYPPAEMIDLPMNPDVPKDVTFHQLPGDLVSLHCTMISKHSLMIDVDKYSTDVQASFYGKEC